MGEFYRPIPLHMFSLMVHAIKWHVCTLFKSFAADKRHGTPRQADPVLSGYDACRPASKNIIWRSPLHFRSSGLTATTIKITPTHRSKREFWRNYAELRCSQSMDRWPTLADTRWFKTIILQTARGVKNSLYWRKYIYNHSMVKEISIVWPQVN